MLLSSSTACTVLQGVWLTACDPRTAPNVAPDLAAYTEAAVTTLRGSRRARAFRSSAVRLLLRAAERVMLPGVCSHYVARKQAIFEIAMKTQRRQVVVLGAGFDGLAWRLATRRPDLRLIEIDHPATQAEKARVLAALPAGEITLLPCDLADGAAASAVIDRLPAVPTLFVAEGLLMYLPEPAVERILRAIAARGDDALVSFMMLNAAGRPTFQARQSLVCRYLSHIGEPFTWGVRPADVTRWMETLGLRVDRLYGAPAAAGAAVEVVPSMIPGEWMASVAAIPRTRTPACP